jgi:hypothetical protein
MNMIMRTSGLSIERSMSGSRGGQPTIWTPDTRLGTQSLTGGQADRPRGAERVSISFTSSRVRSRSGFLGQEESRSFE